MWVTYALKYQLEHNYYLSFIKNIVISTTTAFTNFNILNRFLCINYLILIKKIYFYNMFSFWIFNNFSSLKDKNKQKNSSKIVLFNIIQMNESWMMKNKWLIEIEIEFIIYYYLIYNRFLKDIIINWFLI